MLDADRVIAQRDRRTAGDVDRKLGQRAGPSDFAGEIQALDPLLLVVRVHGIPPGGGPGSDRDDVRSRRRRGGVRGNGVGQVNAGPVVIDVRRAVVPVLPAQRPVRVRQRVAEIVQPRVARCTPVQRDRQVLAVARADLEIVPVQLERQHEAAVAEVGRRIADDARVALRAHARGAAGLRGKRQPQHIGRAVVGRQQDGRVRGEPDALRLRNGCHHRLDQDSLRRARVRDVDPVQFRLETAARCAVPLDGVCGDDPELLRLCPVGIHPQDSIGLHDEFRVVERFPDIAERVVVEPVLEGAQRTGRRLAVGAGNEGEILDHQIEVLRIGGCAPAIKPEIQVQFFRGGRRDAVAGVRPLGDLQGVAGRRVRVPEVALVEDAVRLPNEPVGGITAFIERGVEGVHVSGARRLCREVRVVRPGPGANELDVDLVVVVEIREQPAHHVRVQLVELGGQFEPVLAVAE